jgi:hypothetical protein
MILRQINKRQNDITTRDVLSTAFFEITAITAYISLVLQCQRICTRVHTPDTVTLCTNCTNAAHLMSNESVAIEIDWRYMTEINVRYLAVIIPARVLPLLVVETQSEDLVGVWCCDAAKLGNATFPGGWWRLRSWETLRGVAPAWGTNFRPPDLWRENVWLW